MKIVNNIAVIGDDSHISVWVEESGRLDHDWYFLKHIGEYIKEGDVVLDVGAYIGDHTIYYANKVGLTGRVHAFEPNPRAYECLKYNMNKYSNTTLYEVALSDREGEVKVIEPCENIGMAYVEEGEGVKTMIADNLNLDIVHLIKIDVEGHEIDVLNGCKNIIDKFSPILIIEINKHTLNRFNISKQDLFDKISELGYSFRNIYPNVDMSGEQFDIICEKI